MSATGEPWRLVGECSVNALPVIDPPTERIEIAPMAIHRVRGLPLVHLAPSWPDISPPKRTLCGVALTGPRARRLTIDPPLGARSRSGITTCSRCYNSPTLAHWLAGDRTDTTTTPEAPR